MVGGCGGEAFEILVLWGGGCVNFWECGVGWFERDGNRIERGGREWNIGVELNM